MKFPFFYFLWAIIKKEKKGNATNYTSIPITKEAVLHRPLLKKKKLTKNKIKFNDR